MRRLASQHSQRGITLFVGMIMLVLITVMVTSAFMLSNTNLKAVGNMQAKEEAVAAANQAIEQFLSSPFIDDKVEGETIDVDINLDDKPDYQVVIADPVCVRASVDTNASKSSITLPNMSTVTSWNTVWDIQATVENKTTGAKTVVNSGVRVLLTQEEKTAVCN